MKIKKYGKWFTSSQYYLNTFKINEHKLCQCFYEYAQPSTRTFKIVDTWNLKIISFWHESFEESMYTIFRIHASFNFLKILHIHKFQQKISYPHKLIFTFINQKCYEITNIFIMCEKSIYKKIRIDMQTGNVRERRQEKQEGIVKQY